MHTPDHTTFKDAQESIHAGQLAQAEAIRMHLARTNPAAEARRRASRIIDRFIAPPARFGSNTADRRRDTGTPEWFAAGIKARELRPALEARILGKIEGRAA